MAMTGLGDSTDGTIHRDAKIYVAGHSGLVGSAILRHLEEKMFSNLILRTRVELDLTCSEHVAEFFRIEKPEHVILCAARVGGIMANSNYPAEFYYENTAIQTNVIHESWKNGVKRLLCLGSSCIYPRECPQPMKEEYLMTGPLEPTNRPYALSKIASIEMCWAYNRQYGTRYLCVMPTNLYGPGDNYNLETSHVLPAMIRKFHEAKIASKPTTTMWGTGSPKREFLYSDDLAEAILFLMDLSDERIDELVAKEDVAPLVNIGSGIDLTIQELAETVKEIVGYKGELEWDTTKPDGTPRKLLDVSRMTGLGWQYSTQLGDGISKAYKQFLERAKSGEFSP